MKEQHKHEWVYEDKIEPCFRKCKCGVEEKRYFLTCHGWNFNKYTEWRRTK